MMHATAPVLREPASMQVFIKLLTGHMMTVDVRPSDSVLSLKEKIKDAQGIKVL